MTPTGFDTLGARQLEAIVEALEKLIRVWQTYMATWSRTPYAVYIAM